MAGADPQLRSADDAEHRGGLSGGVRKNKTPERMLSGVSIIGRFHTGNDWFGFVAGLLNSECPEQDRADESKHGAYSEHIPLQGKLHGSASLLK